MYVDASNNIIDSLFNTLDISNNENLLELYLNNNPLENLVISGLPQLQILDISNAAIIYLDLRNYTNLTQINASNGALQEVKLNNGFNSNLTSVELNNNTSLECIQVDDATYSNSALGWVKDSGASYSEYCGFAIRDFPYEDDFENGSQGWNIVNI